MPDFAVLRFEKVKSRIELESRSRHNRRLGKVPSHVDVSLSRLNHIEGNGVEAFERVSEGVKMRKNGVLAVEAVLGFSPEAKLDVAKWTKSSVQWMEKEFGAENIGEVALHLDEQTPHLHVIFFPRDPRGKWNWRGLVPGRDGMARLQTRYAEAVADLGLARGIPKIGRSHVDPGVHRELEKARAEVEKVKSTTREEILKDVESFLGAQVWLEFLKWMKDRAMKKKLKEKLVEDLIAKDALLDPKAVTKGPDKEEV